MKRAVKRAKKEGLFLDASTKEPFLFKENLRRDLAKAIRGYDICVLFFCPLLVPEQVLIHMDPSLAMEGLGLGMWPLLSQDKPGVSDAAVEIACSSFQ